MDLLKGLFTEIYTELNPRDGEVYLDCIKYLLPLSERTREYIVSINYSWKRRLPDGRHDFDRPLKTVPKKEGR